MSTPVTPPPAADHCESCGRPAQVTVTYPDTTFLLCVRCVPAELLSTATTLPGVDVQLELLLEQHRHLALPATAP